MYKLFNIEYVFIKIRVKKSADTRMPAIKVNYEEKNL